MEKFLHFDLNRNGLISLEEANRSNATIEQFKQVDANNDGFKATSINATIEDFKPQLGWSEFIIGN